MKNENEDLCRILFIKRSFGERCTWMQIPAASQELRRSSPRQSADGQLGMLPRCTDCFLGSYKVVSNTFSWLSSSNSSSLCGGLWFDFPLSEAREEGAELWSPSSLIFPFMASCTNSRISKGSLLNLSWYSWSSSTCNYNKRDKLSSGVSDVTSATGWGKYHTRQEGHYLQGIFAQFKTVLPSFPY